MSQPPGYIDTTRPHHVCRLTKALYGLKQAPRAWFHKLKTFLHSHGFRSCYSDSSLFVRHHGDSLTYMLVCFDDLVITGNDNVFIESFISHLNATFSLKDLGALNYFLGIEVHYTTRGIVLSQAKYARDLLCKAKIDGAKQISSPVVAGTHLSHDGPLLDDPTFYRSVVGALQYATITRPDLSYAVNQVCQYMQRPTVQHWQAVKRILRYIKGTLSYGIHIRPSQSNRLIALADANWAGDHDTMRSTHGFCVYYGGNLVSWSSRKQTVVAKSSTEAEYRGIANATAEILWVQQLMRELHIHQSDPPVLLDRKSVV